MVSQQSASIQLNKIAPPGLPKFPLVGMWPFLGKHLHLALNKLTKKYGNIFQIHVGGRTLVVLNGLETIREALVNQQDSFNSRPDFDIYQQQPQCYFMEAKSGNRWRKHRSIIGQVMHTFVVGKSDILESWALKEAADLANIVVNSKSQPFDSNLYLPRATLSFMQRLLFDKRGSIDNSEEDTDFAATAHHLINLNKGAVNLAKIEIIPAIWRPLFIISRWKALRGFIRAATVVERYILKNVEQHRESFDPENLRDITDGLLKASSELTESDRTTFS